MSARHPLLLDRDGAALVVVDMQEPFLRSIFERDRVVAQCRLLIKAATLLDVPIIATVQYAQRMGGLIKEIGELFGSDAAAAYDKMVFSCCGSDEFKSAIAASGRWQILMCGVETHNCVTQTALDLINHGNQVHVALDAVSSRTASRHEIGIQKMRDAGVVPCSAEQAIFEMLYAATAPEFKAIHALIK